MNFSTTAVFIKCKRTFLFVFLCTILMFGPNSSAFAQKVDKNTPVKKEVKNENGKVVNTPFLYPYDITKNKTYLDSVKASKKVILFDPNHPGNKTIEEGRQQAL
ncbi:MAG: hypothetical protein IIA45_01640 [Bacteroidetes bacterium]|nr:hypothetical protein [Bacteroidota bacterium]